MGSGEGPRDGSPVKGGVGSSGGQILSGIGSLASGLRLGTGTVGDAGSIVNPMVDLTSFINGVIGSGNHIRKVKEKKRESVDLGPMMGGSGMKEKDLVVGGSLKLLWSGRVADIVRMRETDGDPSSGAAVGGAGGSAGTNERDRGRDSDRWKKRRLPERVASDGEVDDKGRKPYDGRSTEEESDSIPVTGHASSFGGMWSGRVKGKLGNWAGYVVFPSFIYYSDDGWRRLARKKHQSVDLTATPPSGTSPVINLREPSITQNQNQHSRSVSRLVIGSMSRQLSANHGSGAQSPTLPLSLCVISLFPDLLLIGAVNRYGERDLEDDDLLSSGQVSPLSTRVLSCQLKLSYTIYLR